MTTSHLTLRNLVRDLEARSTQPRRVNDEIFREIAEGKQVEETPQRAHDELEQRVEARTAELSQANAGLKAEIAERKRIKELLRKINGAYKALSECNRALIHASDETELLQQVCRVIRDDCEYHLVWIGVAEKDLVGDKKSLSGDWGLAAGDSSSAHLRYTPTAIRYAPTAICSTLTLSVANKRASFWRFLPLPLSSRKWGKREGGKENFAVLDMEMKVLGGAKVYPLLLEARPELEVILASSQVFDIGVQYLLDEGAKAVVTKPLDPSTLFDVFSRALASQKRTQGLLTQVP